jgi:AraC-like DNA-binding protein
VHETLVGLIEPYLRSFKAGLFDDCVEHAPTPLGSAVGRLGLLEGQAFGVFQIDLDALNVVAISGPGSACQLPESSWLSLLYVTTGEVTLFSEQACWRVGAGSCLVVAGQRLRWQSSDFSLVSLMLPLEGISELADLLLPGCSDCLKDPGQLVAPGSRQRGHDQVVDSLLVSLDRLLTILLHVYGAGSSLLPQLGVSELLCRIVLLVAFPQLRSDCLLAKTLRDQMASKDAFDRLIVYIRDNLDQPLNLTLLEKRSSYSRRALQYAFKERLGCTATQWIRAQRLDLAHQLLRNPAPGDTVASIAQASGYRSMGLFSIEFQQRFHIKPSQLLREARAHWPS